MACASRSAVVEVAEQALGNDELALGDVQRTRAHWVQLPVARDRQGAAQVTAHEHRVARHVHDVELLAARPRVVHRQPAEQRQALGGDLDGPRQASFVAFGGGQRVERGQIRAARHRCGGRLRPRRALRAPSPSSSASR